MIWTLRVACVYGTYLRKECERVLEVDERNSLYQLHLAILDAVGFDNDHLWEFFGGRSWRNRKFRFTESESWEDNAEAYVEITLDQVYPLPPRHKLFFRFDYGDEWHFEISKSRKKPRPPEPGVSYPRLVEEIGPSPAQYG